MSLSFLTIPFNFSTCSKVMYSIVTHLVVTPYILVWHCPKLIIAFVILIIKSFWNLYSMVGQFLNCRATPPDIIVTVCAFRFMAWEVADSKMILLVVMILDLPCILLLFPWTHTKTNVDIKAVLPVYCEDNSCSGLINRTKSWCDSKCMKTQS